MPKQIILLFKAFNHKSKHAIKEFYYLYNNNWDFLTVRAIIYISLVKKTQLIFFQSSCVLFFCLREIPQTLIHDAMWLWGQRRKRFLQRFKISYKKTFKKQSFHHWHFKTDMVCKNIVQYRHFKAAISALTCENIIQHKHLKNSHFKA